jgi:Hypothetical protein (DUF2513)
MEDRKVKRDDDFIRDLLFEAEASDKPYLMAVMMLSPSEEDLKRHIHAKWLADDKYFEEVGSGIFRITNRGNDYLASIRDDKIWKKTKDTAASVGGVALGVMKDISVAYVKQELSTRFGLSL